MSELEKALGEQKTKGRRMMIEESDESGECSHVQSNMLCVLNKIEDSGSCSLLGN